MDNNHILKVQRRISLQTKARDELQELPESVIKSIAQHQNALFNNKLSMLEKAYSLEREDAKFKKIMNDWVYIASNYCFLLVENHLDGCDELAVELFTAFHIILTNALLPNRNNLLLSDVERQYIEIFRVKHNTLMQSRRSRYYSIIIKYLNRLKKIDEMNISASQKRRSLDPKAFQSIQLRSPSELYPQTGIGKLRLSGSSLEEATSSDSSDNDSVLEMMHSLKTIDIETFLQVDPRNLTIINIQVRKLNSQKRNIITIDPSLVSDSASIDHLIIPYLKQNEVIVLFSKSPNISGLETEMFNQLSKRGFDDIYWLQGGFNTFKLHCISPQTFSPSTRSLLTPKIPLLNSDSYEHFNTTPSSRSPQVIPQPIPPPIPISQPLIKQTDVSINGIINGYSNNSQSNLNNLNNGSHNQHSIVSTSTTTYNEPSKLSYKPIVRLRNLGSTCYINSLIQCLFSLEKFRGFFLNDAKLKDYLTNLNGSKAWLTSSIHELFNDFYKYSPHNTQPPVIDMTRFLSIVAKKNPEFNIPHEQQDSSQFLYYIVDQLHKELKFSSSRALELHLVEINNRLSEKYTKYQYKLLEDEGYSYIKDLFNIREGVKMKCNRCGYTSVKYDTSIMLHLSINKRSTSLNEIMSFNFQPEEMSERLGNAWSCDGCKESEKRFNELQDKVDTYYDIINATTKLEPGINEQHHKKKKKFFRPFGITSSKGPKHSDSEVISRQESVDPEMEKFINSFTDAEKSEYDKLLDITTRERVAYRTVEIIDLPNILVICLSLFHPNKQDTKVNMKSLKFPEKLTMEYESCCRVYKLNSWVDHWGGSLDSGHYTATVDLLSTQWLVCDDDKIQPAYSKMGGVDDSNVYLLFYEAL